jgi:hypothetical protein
MRRARFQRAAAVAAGAVCVAGAVLAGAASAATQQFKAVVEFSAMHECTRELVEGDTRVHMVITTSENPDGSTHVRVHQQTHGQSLVGVVSGDEYVFNNGQDVVEHADLVGSTGRVVSRTEFIHKGEDQAFLELPGLDDWHQRLIVTFTPLLPPTVERDRSECR